MEQRSTRVMAAVVMGLCLASAGCSEEDGPMAMAPAPFGTAGQPAPAAGGSAGVVAPTAGVAAPTAGAPAPMAQPPTAGAPPMATGGSDAPIEPPPTGDPAVTDPTQPADPAPADPPAGGDRILPPVDSVDADGPFAVTIDEDAGGNWVFRPAELGQDGLKHPVFIWGTGATAVPSAYVDHFNRMASHGFVIVAPTPAFLSASNMAQALDWILEENDRSGSDYYQMLDPDRIAMGGHSQGSTSTFDQEAMESRLKTTIHIAGGSFDGLGSSKVKTPTAYICGETDIARENCERDFMNVEDQPTFFSILTGVDHIQAARSALPAMIAWLRWHLAGETERAAQFTGPDGEFHQGIWVSDTANWSF